MADLDSSEEECPKMSNEVELTQSSSFVVGECFKSLTLIIPIFITQAKNPYISRTVVGVHFLNPECVLSIFLCLSSSIFLSAYLHILYRFVKKSILYIIIFLYSYLLVSSTKLSTIDWLITREKQSKAVLLSGKAGPTGSEKA